MNYKTNFKKSDDLKSYQNNDTFSFFSDLDIQKKSIFEHFGKFESLLLKSTENPSFSSAKKEQKKSSPSSSSGAVARKVIDQWLEPYEQLELLTPVMVKYIDDQIKKKLISQGFDLNEIQHLEYTDYVNIIRPYVMFNNYLRKSRNRTETWDFMKLAFYEPTTVMHLCLDFPTEDHKETKNLEKRARRLLKKMESFGILSSITVGSKLHGIGYNRRLRNCAIYFVPDYHTKEEIDSEIKRYGVYAERIGMLRDMIDPEEKIIDKLKEQVVRKKKKQTLETILDQTEEGQLLNQVIQQNKMKKQLDNKATKRKVLLTPKDQQSKEIQNLLIPIMDKIAIPTPDKLLLSESGPIEIIFEKCLKCGKSTDSREFFVNSKGRKTMCITCAKRLDCLR